MANAPGSWKPPITLILLDAIGVVLLGFGVAERFAGTNFVPEWLQFDGYDLFMMIFGALLMLPLVANVVTHVMRQSRA